MDRKEIKDFCKDFAYRFISTECMEKEFANMKCSDAKEVSIHLGNSLDLDLQEWLEERGIELNE